MNRTYDVFVDNGLYILSSYLDKDIEEVVIQDIIDSTEMMANKFAKYEGCDFYKKNISMGFQNSSYTQKSSVIEQFDLVLKNIGEDEYCSICGEKHIKLMADSKYLSSMSRVFMPKIHANTFANYINNLQTVNICPVCLYLSMLSLFNCTKTSDTLTLYISDDNEFMEDYTYRKQSEMELNISTDLKFDKKNQKWFYKHIEETVEYIIHNDKMYNGYIQAISFNNSSQTEIYMDNHLSNKDVKVIKLLEEKSLLSEFKEKWLYKYFIDGKLQNNYTSYIVDFSTNKIKVSKELFNELEEAYSKLSKDKLNLIKEVCSKVYSSNCKDELKQLKGVSNINQFENLLISWSEKYKEKTDKVLFTMEEFDYICSIREYGITKNRMIIEFMSL